MKSKLDDAFIHCFGKLPEEVKKTARKNYRLWQDNHSHPGLEFKKISTKQPIYSVRVGMGWRAVGVLEDSDTIAWFWLGSHSDYDKLIKGL
ncbi:MAG: hypothetical protein AAFR25_00380 [Cyanobacteria bacterium J06629_19]